MTKSEKLSLLMKYLIDGMEVSKDNKEVQESLFCSEKTLARYLKELDDKYSEIFRTVQNRKAYYKLIKVSDIFHKFLSTTDDISWLIQLINESDKKIFMELEEKTKKSLNKILSGQKDIFLYQNSPFEIFENPMEKIIFEKLKSAVKNNDYRNIDYYYNNFISYKNVKCLKLIFMENNWYVAVAKEDEKLIFLRISFIQAVTYCKKNSYQSSNLIKYNDFFKTFQNPMTIYDKPKQTAKIIATAKIAKYFKPNMKKFLSSQKFIKENPDKSIQFSLEFTQPLEILPFIQKWLPDLIIIEPKELKEEYIKKLEEMIEKQNKL